ncbi:2-oxoacid:acceptor oxidoreductase family protein [Patescibacteria group bacterium]
MTEIRLHGRGGQGVVTGAELIAAAAFYEGKYSQAFPFFGVERRGAPIEAYARIDNNKFINLREQVKCPDIVIIQDASLLASNPNLLTGLKNEGLIIINTAKDLKDVFKGICKIKSGFFSKKSRNSNDKKTLVCPKHKKMFNVKAIDGTAIALKILGKPIVNTLIVFELAKDTSLFSPASVKDALKNRFAGELLKKNLELGMQV